MVFWKHFDNFEKLIDILILLAVDSFYKVYKGIPVANFESIERFRILHFLWQNVSNFFELKAKLSWYHILLSKSNLALQRLYSVCAGKAFAEI